MNLSTARQAKVDKREAQELKNNQDFIYGTNQWLNQLSGAIEAIKKDMTKHVADVHSYMKGQDISIEKLRSDIECHRDSSRQSLDSQDKKIDASIRDLELSLKSSDSRFLTLQETTVAVLSLQSRLQEMTKEVSRIGQLIGSEIIRVRNEMLSADAQIKKDILEQPTEIPGLKNFIAERIKIFEVNFDGLMLEIERIKKRAFISSKHIEALFDKFTKMETVKK